MILIDILLLVFTFRVDFLLLKVLELSFNTNLFNSICDSFHVFFLTIHVNLPVPNSNFQL